LPLGTDDGMDVAELPDRDGDMWAPLIAGQLKRCYCCYLNFVNVHVTYLAPALYASPINLCLAVVACVTV
jgi:hypothetical protein